VHALAMAAGFVQHLLDSNPELIAAVATGAQSLMYPQPCLSPYPSRGLVYLTNALPTLPPSLTPKANGRPGDWCAAAAPEWLYQTQNFVSAAGRWCRHGASCADLSTAWASVTNLCTTRSYPAHHAAEG